MDQLVTYREIVCQKLTDYAELVNRNPDNSVQSHLLFDDEHQHYMVFKTGWWNVERIRVPTIYIRLHNGKIYIEEDWTEDGIATDLLQAGVPREDIVLAFHPPEMRQYTEFAVE